MLGLFSGNAPGLACCTSRAAPRGPASSHIAVGVDLFELAGAGVESCGKNIGFAAK